jgi:hypothetical protein
LLALAGPVAAALVSELNPCPTKVSGSNLDAMKPRRRKLLAVLIAAIGFAALAESWWLFLRPPGINRRGFDRIQVGMSQGEVEAILGGPPGDYTKQRPKPGESCSIPRESIPPDSEVSNYRAEQWSAGERWICVYFLADGTVIEKEYLDHDWSPSLFERFQRWLGF